MSLRIEDGIFDGITLLVRSDEQISAFSVVTFDLNGASPISVEDASTTETHNPAIGITGRGGIALGRMGIILLFGIIENPAWSWSAPQIPLYLSAVDGVMGEAPAGPIRQQLAVTVNSKKILFDPMEVWEL